MSILFSTYSIRHRHISQILRTRYLQRHGFFFTKVRVSCLPDSRSHFNVAAFSSGAVLLYERKMCLIKSRVHQAGVLHAISPISMKLGQFKGSTPKLKMTNWFIVWIFWWEIAHPTGLITIFTNKSALMTGKLYLI